MKEIVNIFFDGGVFNDQIAGAFIVKSNNKILFSDAKIMPGSTNNMAEYQALIFALESCLEKNIKKIKIYGDSQLVVNQVNGLYKIKNLKLKPLHQKIMKLLGNFDVWTITWIPREQNQKADALINKLFGRKK